MYGSANGLGGYGSGGCGSGAPALQQSNCCGNQGQFNNPFLYGMNQAAGCCGAGGGMGSMGCPPMGGSSGCCGSYPAASMTSSCCGPSPSFQNNTGPACCPPMNPVNAGAWAVPVRANPFLFAEDFDQGFSFPDGRPENDQCCGSLYEPLCNTYIRKGSSIPWGISGLCHMPFSRLHYGKITTNQDCLRSNGLQDYCSLLGQFPPCRPFE